MEYKLCDFPWDDSERKAAIEVINSGNFTMGAKVQEFEKEFARKMGAKYAAMVNSGSSANLLAIAALCYSKKLNPGDEIIVPAVSWSTTYCPLAQFGLKLVFVDIDRETLNIDIKSLEQAINNKTKMIFLVNLLGNPNDFDKIKSLVEGKDIIVAEDNCESLGAKYNGKYAGTFGLFGTYSTFFSHHLCTMEGGVVTTDDRELYDYMLSVRAHGWTRNLSSDTKIYEKKDDPFYESFNFIMPGFNLRPLEMEGAIGIEQLKKMDRMINQRKENGKYFVDKMKTIKNVRVQKEVGESSWFGFAIVLENELSNKRSHIVSRLKDANIESRPIVAGNYTKNRAIEYMNYSIPFELRNANEIHDCGFFIGNHSINNNKEVDYFIQVLTESI